MENAQSAQAKILDLLQQNDYITVTDKQGIFYTIDGQDIIDYPQHTKNDHLPARKQGGDKLSWVEVIPLDAKTIALIKTPNPAMQETAMNEKWEKDINEQLRESELLEKYSRFYEAVARKKFKVNPADITEEQQKQLHAYVESMWPQYAKKYLKLETSDSGGVPGYLTPNAFSGGKEGAKARKTSFLKKQGYTVSGEDKADPLYESYFKNDSLSTEQKVDIALREIRETMLKTERLLRHTMKLKQENNSESSLYSDKTKRSLKRISERAIRLISMLETMK